MVACWESVRHTGAMKLAINSKLAFFCLVLAVTLGSLGVARANDPAPRDILIESIARYASQALGVAQERLVVLATDKRLKVPECPEGFEHSFPFGDQATVKTRCADPEWQAFIRIKVEQELAQPRPLVSDNKSPGLVLVLRERVHRGQRLSEALVEVREADDKVAPDALSSKQDLDLLEATRLLRLGEVLRASMVKSAPAIKKGEFVTLSFSQGGLSIAVEVEALVDGQVGEVIRFRNRESGQELQAKVTGIGQASL